MTVQAANVLTNTSVTFSWSGWHNVYQSASKADFDSCVRTGGTLLTAAGLDGTYTTTLVDPGTYYYICEVPGHCGAGQKIAITVVGSLPSPSLPPLPPPPPTPHCGG